MVLLVAVSQMTTTWLRVEGSIPVLGYTNTTANPGRSARVTFLVGSRAIGNEMLDGMSKPVRWL